MKSRCFCSIIRGVKTRPCSWETSKQKPSFQKSQLSSRDVMFLSMEETCRGSVSTWHQVHFSCPEAILTNWTSHLRKKLIFLVALSRFHSRYTFTSSVYKTCLLHSCNAEDAILPSNIALPSLPTWMLSTLFIQLTILKAQVLKTMMMMCTVFLQYRLQPWVIAKYFGFILLLTACFSIMLI